MGLQCPARPTVAPRYHQSHLLSVGPTSVPRQAALDCTRSFLRVTEPEPRAKAPCFWLMGKMKRCPSLGQGAEAPALPRLPGDLAALVQSVCQELFGVQSPCIFIPFYHVNCSEPLCFCNKKSPFSKNDFVQTCPFNSVCHLHLGDRWGPPVRGSGSGQALERPGELTSLQMSGWGGLQGPFDRRSCGRLEL